MGWFSSSPAPEKEVDKTAAPTRQDREQCWAARDAYFACLDHNANETEKCKREQGKYEGSCAASWVEYFNKRRILALRQELLEKRAAEDREAIAAASKKR